MPPLPAAWPEFEPAPPVLSSCAARRFEPCAPQPPERKKLGGGPVNVPRRLLRPDAGRPPAGPVDEYEPCRDGAGFMCSRSYFARFVGEERIE
ncbi:hypothetical protein RRF57_007861 [Xylaria bambusicola]|uniref:Uncharacterized protein n=1 Tax=Xylaria bambusicola TaxID=326684 RepID=A0AAN7Z6L9_9PEZI